MPRKSKAITKAESALDVWQDEALADLTEQQRIFVLAFAETCNATEAARRAYQTDDYDTLRAIGYEVKNKPHVRAAIDRLLSRRVMSEAEALSLLADHAHATADDFTSLAPVVQRQLRIRPVREVLAEVEAEISLEEEYARYAEFDAAEQETHARRMKELRRRAIRYRLLLAQDGDAVVEAYGRPEEVLEPVVDLAKAKERGKLHVIKSIRRDKAGRLTVEAHDAQAALDKVLRVHGTYAEKEGGGTQVNVQINNYQQRLEERYGK